ncbi:MAG: thiamine-phosphate kinase [Planctomycetota bacterium]|nr:thiamine-phosphate kinase [Planctomycetota bacterium]
MSWSEDRIHRALGAGARPRGLAGSRGHDAAVLARIEGLPVVCVDACIEGVHFTSAVSPRAAGGKACARALSDLAATAARPRAVVLALSVPRQCSEAWILGAIAGVRAMARAHGADLVGGDLAAATGPAQCTVTALGEYAGAGRPPGRDRARAGQAVVLTGPTGGSILGRHLRIAPRIEQGIRLHALGATALMDVSDGLAWDLFRLARASSLRIELDMSAVPIHRDARKLARRTGAAPWEHALHDGEDHELVATMPKLAATRAGARPIGRVVRGTGLELVFADKRVEWSPAMGGWKHGA